MFVCFILISRRIYLAPCSNVFGVVPLSPSGCLIWEWFQTLTGQILFLDVEILLIARGYLPCFNPPQWLTLSHLVFAYYGRNRALLVALLFLLAVNLSAVVGIDATSLPQAQFKTNEIPLFHSGSCINTNISLKFYNFWYVKRSVLTREQC